MGAMAEVATVVTAVKNTIEKSQQTYFPDELLD